MKRTNQLVSMILVFILIFSGCSKSEKPSKEPVVIENMGAYYKVTLDFTNATHYEIGMAYAKAIQSLVPDYAHLFEEVLYESIIPAFKKPYGSYDPLLERIHDVSAQMDQDYLDEIQGMSESNETISSGFNVDGILSWEEYMAMQLLPDVVRPTQCSGVSVYGEKSATGKPITGRVLEWNLGYDKQLTKLISVTEFINGEKSFYSVGVLGNLNGITVYNDNGVFLAILDSSCKSPFLSHDKRSYTYDVRKAAEDYTNAKDAGEFLVQHATEYTFSHNVLISDDSSSMVAENCTDESLGISALRTAESERMDKYLWNNADSLCVINAFALKDSTDNLNADYQYNRWLYYNEILSHFSKLTKEDVKTVMTYDDLTNANFQKVYSSNTLFMCVVDASDHSIEVACNPYSSDRTIIPEFIKVK